MKNFLLSSEQISIEISSSSGETVSVRRTGDPLRTNWVAPESGWGRVDGFRTLEIQWEKDTVVATAEDAARNLAMTVEKRVAGEFYEEIYRIVNEGSLEFFLTRGNFAFHYPFNCHLAPRPDLLRDVCVSHIWCGGDNSWIHSEKPSGDEPGLTGILAEGSLADYSIDYDASRTGNGSHYRGEFLLHPEERILLPGETLKFRFLWSFGTTRPDRDLLAHRGQRIFVRSEELTVLPGEPLRGILKTAYSWETLHIGSGDGLVRYRKNGNAADWECVFTTPGERTIRFTAGDCSTWIRVNVQEDTETILRRRAAFIAEKQQYHRAGSHLDGACLIYDRATGRMFCDNAFPDSNSARERLAMGCILALEQQRRPTSALERALNAYRTYLERELLERSSMTVFDGPCRPSRIRAYDYPWMAFFYREYAAAMREPDALQTAAGIMLSYYRLVESTAQDSPCIEDVRLVRALERNGFRESADALRKAALHHADVVLEQGTSMYSEEVSYTQAQFALKAISLCQAFQLSGDRRYLDIVPAFLRSVAAFGGEQPDFHCFGQGVRYWDLYWFGKMKTYGDTMPQWLSSCTGEMFMLCGEALGDPAMTAFGRAVLRNALCVFAPDGFASAGFLMPYRVRIFDSKHGEKKRFFPLGTVYGKRYDDWSNDQDWSLCFAAARHL